MKTKIFTALMILWTVVANANFTPKSTADSVTKNTFTASTDTLVKYSVVAIGDTNIVDSWGDYKTRKFAVMVQDEENEPKPKKKKQQNRQIDSENEPKGKGNRAFIYTTIATTLIAIVQILKNCK